MRPPNSSLPARDAWRALAHQQRQLRLLSSAALSASSASTATAPTSSANSPLFPLKLTFSATSFSPTKVRSTRRPRPPFAFAYSTSNPAYPLPGSNNEIDPHGVDFSLFEPEDEVYAQQASSSTSTKSADGDGQDASTSMTGESIAALSPSTQLLARLIQEEDFKAATTALYQFQSLGTTLNEPLPEFAVAALWAIKRGRRHDMLSWMRLCPEYTPSKRGVEAESSVSYAGQDDPTVSHILKCFVVLLEGYGDELELLQQASLIAAEKGHWSVIRSSLAQILRYGIGGTYGSDASNSVLAWQYFKQLVLGHRRERARRLRSTRQELMPAHPQLRALYNLGIRTLALAGRLDDAISWAQHSARTSHTAEGVAHIVSTSNFTQRLLFEELFRAGGEYVQKAYSLAELLACSSKRGRRAVELANVDGIAKRIARETASSLEAESVDTEAEPEARLDAILQTHLDQGDVFAAREHLLSVLRSAEKVRRTDDSPMPEDYAPGSKDAAVFAHLPSARTLSKLQDLAYSYGTVPITVSLTESDVGPAGTTDGSQASPSQEAVGADKFLSPVRKRLLTVRGGKGLYETATLYGLVKKAKWKAALDFYVGSNGFKMPAGGITSELIALALAQSGLPPSERSGHELAARRLLGKYWPSTHAINLVLRAVVGVCMDAKDYARLTRVYELWKETASMRRMPDSEHEGEQEQKHTQEHEQEQENENENEHEDNGSVSLAFEHWPPSQPPSSRTFDGFIRAFARLEVDVATSGTASGTESETMPGQMKKQVWGSSQAVLGVIRDMTERFGVQPSVSTWTIALECLAREGRERWTNTTSILARAVGINTISPLSAAADEAEPVLAQGDFAPANLATYTAVVHALLRVSHGDGGSMVEEAAAVRDDLLARTADLDLAVRSLVRSERNDGEEAETFWSDLLERWEAVQQAVSQRGTPDQRQQWHAHKMLKANGGRTVEALRELWLLESSPDTPPQTY
ncbi:hypothetical protein PANT_15c00037 [Moesziomyces antarcticus T-34]|uniref:Uncharacterized protein n=1 Tax=Pseudozyma antarctica (strain T-34) TaxID=1151754 RepID=M9MEJ6_PSEA3|nr:hypothetical protein PANT_15c00037 [Moesziomyces antarcticus T-34]